MAKHRRTLTDEEREQRRAEQRELVRASIEQLRSSDGWQAYLKARARFHVLLVAERPLDPSPAPDRRASRRVPRLAEARLLRDEAPRRRPEGGGRSASGRGARRARSGCRRGVTRAPTPTRSRAATYKLVSVFAQDQVAELPPPAKPVPLPAADRRDHGRQPPEL